MLFETMNSFDFENAGATHHQTSYDWHGSLSKLIYRLQLVGAVVFLGFLVYCIPIAAEFFRRLSAFVSAPPFVFVFFNVVIVVLALSVKFGMFSVENVSRENDGGTDEEKEEEEKLIRKEVRRKNDDVSRRPALFGEVDDVPGKSFFVDLNNDVAVGGRNRNSLFQEDSLMEEEEVVVEDKEVIVCEAAATSQTTPLTPIPILCQTTTSHEVGVDSTHQYKCDDDDQNPVDELSCEEFKKKIEAFIENARTFRR